MKTPQTSVPELKSALGLANEVWLKREDKHHYGSHKGRSIPLMINKYRKEGRQNFTISSSGNAALAAIAAIQTHNKNNTNEKLQLAVFVGEHINADKLKAINEKIAGDTNITLKQTDAPKQAAFQLAEDKNVVLLRQSTDDTALLGYAELAEELGKIENLSAVFIPTSSGTTAEGLFQGFQKLGLNPEIHIVQTTSCHPIVDLLSPIAYRLSPEHSLATAIVDKIAHRKTAVVEAIKNSHGSGWIATNADIIAAQTLAKKILDLDLSPNSALSIVGLTQAIQAGKKWRGPVACLITGP